MSRCSETSPKYFAAHLESRTGLGTAERRGSQQIVRGGEYGKQNEPDSQTSADQLFLDRQQRLGACGRSSSRSSDWVDSDIVNSFECLRMRLCLRPEVVTTALHLALQEARLGEDNVDPIAS